MQNLRLNTFINLLHILSHNIVYYDELIELIDIIICYSFTSFSDILYLVLGCYQSYYIILISIKSRLRYKG